MSKRNYCNSGINNVEKGRAYEKYVAFHLNNKVPETKIAYLWKDVPEQLLYDAGLITDYNRHRLKRKHKTMGVVDSINGIKDIGVDIVHVKHATQSTDGDTTTDCKDSIEFVQCKNYNNTICTQDLAGFFMVMLNHPDKRGVVYHSLNKLSRDLIENRAKHVQYLHLPLPEDWDNGEINATSKKLKLSENQHTGVTLRDYQIDAAAALIKFYETETKGILSMPCGTGKTLVSCYVAVTFAYVIFLSPLKQFAEQNLERFQEYERGSQYQLLTSDAPTRNYVLVDSDGIRDVAELEEICKCNKRLMLSATYKSADVIVQILPLLDLTRTIVIIDEFHNLSIKNVFGANRTNISTDDVDELDDEDDVEEVNDNPEESDDKEENSEGSDDDDFDNVGEAISDTASVVPEDSLFQIINSMFKILFMSATPRVFELEGTDDDTSVEDLLGKVVYKMDFSTALKNKYVADYRIYLPILIEDSKRALDVTMNDIQTELQLKDIDLTVSHQCCFIFESIKQLGTLKCICYFQSHGEINAFIQTMKNINNYFCYNFLIDSITFDDSQSQRRKKLDAFAQSENNAFLCSVKILDECIDIAECNSIFMSYPSKSKVKIVQRLSRALRPVQENQNKIAKLLLWCDEFDDVAESLSTLKEYDGDYSQKVKPLCFHHGYQRRMEVNEIVGRIHCVINGIKEYHATSWDESYNQLKMFLEKYGRRPKSTAKDNFEWLIGRWSQRRHSEFVHGKLSLKTSEKWQRLIDDHPYGFISINNRWFNVLSSLDKFVSETQRRPSKRADKVEERFLARWLTSNLTKFRTNKTNNMQRYNSLYEVLHKFPKLLCSKQDYWEMMFNSVKQFITTNKRIPYRTVKDKYETQLGLWLQSNQSLYIQNNERRNIPNFRSRWETFNLEYRNYNWNNLYENLKQYLTTHGKSPSNKGVSTRELGNWFQAQCRNYKQNWTTHDEMYIKWTELINQFPKVFK